MTPLEKAEKRATELGGELSLGGTGVACRYCDAMFAQVLDTEGKEIDQIPTCDCCE